MKLRSFFLAATTTSLLLGCAVSSSPYRQPDGAETASVRFRVAHVATDAIPYFGGVFIFNYGDEHCSPSRHGRYIDQVGTDKTFVSRTEQSIGMPMPEPYPRYRFVERRFPANQPLVFSFVVDSGGPARYCQRTYKLDPVPGRSYEVQLSVLGYENCEVRIVRLESSAGSVGVVPEPSGQVLPRFCESPSILN